MMHDQEQINLLRRHVARMVGVRVIGDDHQSDEISNLGSVPIRFTQTPTTYRGDCALDATAEMGGGGNGGYGPGRFLTV